ncbi:MAG: LysR family transcriptional regulator [Betaproteobacteria bacterium]|nr:LysR family transcriptional regulator [Betaproteobacteria bacterium]
MSRAEEINAFIISVESGGFSAAARKLELTPSALSKLVSRLEDRLGSRLLHRTTRRLQLTVEGETFYNRTRPILAALDDAEDELRQVSGSPRGVLRVRCSSVFAVHQLTHAIPRFLEQHPGITLNLTIHDGPIAAVDDNVDLAIRIGTPEETTAVVRHICNVQRVICAAPSYLERFGTPQTPDDLHHHNCLWITSLPALRRWSFDTDEGIRIVHIDGNVIANNAEMVLQLALAGVGITSLADVIVGDAIRSGALVPVLAEWQHPEPVPLLATYPSSRNLSPKVRAMVDFLVKEFSHAPWRQPPTH